ncbi:MULTISPECIES: TIGR00341 family protein [unclassified Coleofasciculus]|uniref:TIGR00341 family protein n=1 Tax=unclassified Coleofasciculus TaxID=2692782 RepID=UPI00187FDB08|nr:MULTISPECIES: TIGR00341 family protein [unclassified Coleofasciculus]MBE9129828.1 TIGR00341 family protein [Coleofasciculus sp. LEGE 07081]MBE9151963.1 TIGR00341 family protein [Coleofasciculus sp. LEGE 07092]
MRQLLVQVPRGQGKAVLDIAKDHEGANLAKFEATDGEKPVDLVVVHVPNRQVEDLLGELEPIPQLYVTLNPRGVIPLQPPPDEAPQQVKDVAMLSPLEVFLGGVQSIGSWKGFLGYAALGAVVAWIGLYTNTMYLLTAAMLIAPFAGPAMNLAIATARGDKTLLWRSLLRYFAALVVSMVVAGLLSFLLRQENPTSQMLATSTISATALLLPLSAGAAGALNLMQSERSSLVSGAATGMLVAASLAPPTALVGMASAIGRWDMAINAVFVLLLQLVGINLSATIIFRIFGLSARGARYKRGKKAIVLIAFVTTIVALAALLTWQFSSVPELQRGSLEQRITSDIQKVVKESDLAEPIEVNIRFTASDIKGQNTILGTIYVEQQAGVKIPSEEIRQRLSRHIQSYIYKQNYKVTPLIDVSVLEPPPPP